MPIVSEIDPATGKRKRNSMVSRVHVRALLAVIFTGGLTYGFLTGLVTPEDYKEIALIAIIWYFSKRNSEENGSNKNVPDV